MRRPKGIKLVLERHADRIYAAVDEAGFGFVDFDNLLGCGSFGCVYPIRSGTGFDDKLVCKISVDETEGPVVRAIMATGLDKRLAGLCRWEAIWKVPIPIYESGPRRTAWIIVREAVTPYWDSDFFRVGARWAAALRSYNDAARIVVKSKRPQQRARENADIALGQLSISEETYFVAEAIEELQRRDIMLADVHMGNLGVRTNETERLQIVRWEDGIDRPPLLIFDPGHSSYPEGVVVPELWKTANPWMPDAEDDIEPL